MRRFLTATQPIPEHFLHLFNFDQTDDNRVSHQACTMWYAETCHQLSAMRFDSLGANLQHLRDLFRGPAFSDQAQHFALSWTQRREEISLSCAFAVFEQSLSRGFR